MPLRYFININKTCDCAAVITGLDPAVHHTAGRRRIAPSNLLRVQELHSRVFVLTLTSS